MKSESAMIPVYLAIGAVFGLVLSRSGAADYNYIQGMFLFEEFQLYGIIGTAVAVTAPGLWLLKRYGKTLTGRPIVIERKAGHRGNLYGGILFGVGWSNRNRRSADRGSGTFSCFVVSASRSTLTGAATRNEPSLSVMFA